MRGAAASMLVMRPRTVNGALAMYAQTPEALPLVGGTDLMVTWNLGEMNDRIILDLSQLREWSRIEETSTGLTVGALATHTDLQRHPIVRRRFPLLVAACATVGGVQIQNRGTIGGNIANASPAGDTLPSLAVYEAQVQVVSAKGTRQVPFLDIFAGVKKTTLGPGELIAAIDLPFPPRGPQRQLFRKVGTRAAQAISKTVAAGLLWLERDGRVRDVRFSLGSMAPTVRRLRSAESFLTGRPLTRETIREASALLTADVTPIDDIRSTATYRLATSRRLLESFLEGPDA
jgi:CO/xanthine dehydrogenase FAD-binding subunit